MGLFNDSGLMTKGFGRDQRLITRGYGSSFEVGGPGPWKKREVKEYELNLVAPILRENLLEFGIYSPLKIKRDEQVSINLSVFKKIEEDLNLVTRIDHSKLSEMLDVI